MPAFDALRQLFLDHKPRRRDGGSQMKTAGVQGGEVDQR